MSEHESEIAFGLSDDGISEGQYINMLK